MTPGSVDGRNGQEAIPMQYQTNMFRGQPDDEAIRMLRDLEPLALQHDPRGYCVCTSEGKDSRVLGHLMRRAGVKHFYLHNITGIDPPELIYFQRRNFQAYRDTGYITYDLSPRISFWKLMVAKKIPPLRTCRYCCAELKEAERPESRDCIMSLGVRHAESVARKKNRAELEIGKSKKDKIIMPYDNDNRQRFEACQIAGERRVNPIIYWTDAMIWDYSREAGMDQCCLYSDGFDRLGCIGCPMVRESTRRHEFERWPGFKKLFLLTFARMLQARRDAGLKILRHTDCAESWFEWWLTDTAQEQPIEGQEFMELDGL